MNAAMNTSSFRRSSGKSHVSPTPAQLPPTIFFDGNRDQQRSSAAQMKSIDLSHESAVWSPPSASIPSRSASASSRQSNASVSSNASSISSMVSFQAITNFLPLSWASRSSVTPNVPSVSAVQHSPAGSLDDDLTVVTPMPPFTLSPHSQTSGGYVSRKQQLSKLKARMEVEGVLTMTMQAQVQCRKCDGAMVHI